jgi:hypothetical protein
MAKTINEKQKEILARKLGYDGPMNMFEQFVKSDPAMERKYGAVIEKYMARGGMVRKYAEGGDVKKIDFANLDITQYPLNATEQKKLNTALQNISKAQTDYNRYAKDPRRASFAANSLKSIEGFKQDVIKTIDGASNDLNAAIANYILNAGERQEGAGFIIANNKLNKEFTSRNLPIPEKLQDINYVKEAYDNITTAANRQAGNPSQINQYQKEFANAFVAKSDLAFTGTRPKEQVLQDVINSVGIGSIGDRIKNALVIEKLAEPVKYAASYVEQPAPAPAAGTTAPSTTAPAAGTTAPSVSVPTTQQPSPEVDQTAQMILQMAVGKIPADLTYDLNGDGRVTSADA